MVLVLCIGDLHIPYRATDLPAKFKALLVPGKIHHILCPGNLCIPELYDYFKTVCPSLHVTRGEFDTNASTYPDHQVLDIGDFRVGLCHGHQVVPTGDIEALAILQRRLNVDILVTGATHEFKAFKYEDRFLINPGSATGAFVQHGVTQVKPSFVLMDIDGSKATVYVYELGSEGDVKVDKIEFTKPTGGGLGV